MGFSEEEVSGGVEVIPEVLEGLFHPGLGEDTLDGRVCPGYLGVR
jgi:hypothetical protein